MKAISNENMQKSISGLEGKVLASGYTLFESLLLILLLTTILSFPVLAFSAWKNELAVYQFFGQFEKRIYSTQKIAIVNQIQTGFYWNSEENQIIFHVPNPDKINWEVLDIPDEITLKRHAFMYTLKMEKMDMPYGQKTISRKCYKGSILFSVLLLFLLCTFLLMAALESYRLSMDLNIRIKNYYIAKIMKQMALSEQSTLAESSEGVFYYTTGSVTYQWVQQSLFLEVEVSPFIFRFTEEVKNDTDTSTE